MKFHDIPYQRPDLEKVLEDINGHIETFKESKTLEKANQALKTYYEAMDHLSLSQELAMIRYTLNTKDPFYVEEQAFFNQESPKIAEVSHRFTKALLDTPFKDALKDLHGSLFIEKYEQHQKVFSSEIMADLALENELNTTYSKLMSSAVIQFDGKELNLSMMAPYATSSDRQVRKEAALKVSEFFQQNESAFDDIYDKLVSVRTKIAKTLGYESFVELAYDRLGRLDYNKDDVATYRKSIVHDVIPYVQTLYKRQQARTGIDSFKRYDEPYTFKSGPAKPKGDAKALLKKADMMYKEMSETTHQFFTFLRSHDALDVEARPNKEGGGYCTILPVYKLPFIFANFNGTSGDVDVLTHEAGHALQMYLSKDLIPEYRMPTLEAAEIHSMSMEFIAWPWMDLFFEEDTQKYYIQHLESALKFLPYGALVDHFQHEIYSKPYMTKEERKTTYRDLEKIYLPHRDYDTDSFMEKGTFWYRQAHIFQVPFYYIDYTLAQVVALEFWSKYQKDPVSTLKTYVDICSEGGSKPFKQLITSHGLSNVFEPGAIKVIIDPIKTFLDQQEDII
jgi:M3 family oligoendopeptidase